MATLQIRLETETDELGAERDAFRRRHEHALLELEHWKRRVARAEDDMAALCEKLDLLAASDSRAVKKDEQAAAMLVTLEQQIEELEEEKEAQKATIAALRAWKAAAMREQEQAHVSEAVAAQRSLEMAERLEQDQARLLRTISQLEADAKRRMKLQEQEAARLAEKEKEVAQLGDELAALRVDNSSLREALLTAEAKSTRIQRELSLLEHVSYFSEAVVDMDTEDDDEDEDDEEEEEGEAVRVESKLESKPEVTAESKPEVTVNKKPLMRTQSSMRRRRASTIAASGSYSAFPSTSVSPDGERHELTPTDVETHTKLHHYFHLTALSIIHENKLHERCFSTSSRFTIDMWYREIVQKDVPFLEWHSWLIDRISNVAAAVKENDDDNVDATPPSSSKGFGFGSSASKSSGTSPGSSAPPKPARVSFTVARAFFRLLWKSSARRERRSDASTP